MGRVVSHVKLPPEPESDSTHKACGCHSSPGLDRPCSSCAAQRSHALSERLPAHSLSTVTRGHNFERIPVHPPSSLDRLSGGTSPPDGGLDARRSAAAGEQEDETAGGEVIFTTTTSEPRIERNPCARQNAEPESMTTPGLSTSTPGPDAGTGSGSGSGGPPAAPPPTANVACNCVESLDASGSGAIEGSFGINEYWTTVTPYWDDNKTLGQFDTTSGSGHLYGHKFQVVGKFKGGTGTAAGEPTFKQLARLSVGTASPGTTGGWFDDMDYTDAGGGKHQWDPNAEAGTTVRTGYRGVRRTIATDKYAYTDPPAVYYVPGTTDTYRKLEFDICFSSPAGCNCGVLKSCISRTQEIEVKKGVPSTLKAP